MSSYFVNSTFPVSLPGGQDSLLGQIPLYSSGYTDPLRHYSNAATYGAANMQEKVYPASYYQQTGAAAIYGRAGGGAPCEYNPVGTFYKDAEGSCAFSSREDQPLFVTQEHQQRKAECPEQSVSMGSSIDDKSSTLIYPWMQRMNACSAGESTKCMFKLSGAPRPALRDGVSVLSAADQPERRRECSHTQKDPKSSDGCGGDFENSRDGISTRPQGFCITIPYIRHGTRAHTHAHTDLAYTTELQLKALNCVTWLPRNRGPF